MNQFLRRAPGARAACALAFVFAAATGHAADKNGLSANAVQLPDGPGSVLGLGPDYDPDLASGTAQYAFDFSIPPIVGDLEPNIGLVYDSGEGNGPLGFGWAIDLPFVERRSSKPLARYIDGDNGIDDDFDGVVDNVEERDRFVSDLHEAPLGLVPVDDTHYLGAEEGPFVRYARAGDGWIGESPDGQKMYFGETAQSRIINPDNGMTFSWQLEREVDPHGNTILYRYARFNDEANAHQVYLEEVSWGAGAPPWDNFHFVHFTWEDRPDVIESGTPGFLLRTGKRLSRVTTGTQGPDLDGHLAGDFNNDGTPDNLNRFYAIGYEAGADFSRLTSITETGKDGLSTRPALTFGYTTSNLPSVLSAEGFVLGSSNTPPQIINNDAVEITELNGDGLADMLVTNPAGGVHKAYLNLGEQTVNDAQAVVWSGAIEVGGDSRVYSVNFATSALPADLSDLNGDGQSDLVVVNGPFEGYYFPQEFENHLPKWGTRTPFYSGTTLASPPSPYGNDEVARTDINGDARGDVIQTISSGGKTRLKIWYNLGGGRFSEPVTVSQNFTYQFSQDKVEFDDFNGDDLPDFVRHTPTTIEVAPGLGYGRFAPVVIAPIPDGLLNQTQLDAAVLEDITADGLPDLIVERAEPNTLWYWENLGDNTLGPRKKITDLPTPAGFNVALRWADFNGNGTTDLVYADEATSPRMQIVDLGGLLGCAPAPNILNLINNGVGRNTVIEHTSSARYALDDAAAGTPWTDPLPFAVEVVSRTVTTDTFTGEYINEFTYHDGYYDTRFKLFSGFARVENADLGDAFAPTQIERYTFDVGRNDYSLKGLVREHSIENEAGGVFRKETTEYEVQPIATGTDGNAVVFARASSTTNVITELGVGTPRTTLTEYDYDDLGNMTEMREYGVVDGDNLGAFNDERITTSTYTNDTDNWMLRFPVRENVRDLDGNLVERQITFYDDETFSGENEGQISRGNVTLERGWYVVDDDEAYVEAERAKFDAFGNVIMVLDGLAQAPGGVVDETIGHYRTMDQDGVFGYYPVLETIHLGDAPDLEIAFAYDYGSGTVISATDVNGNTTTYDHDPFTRLTAMIRPGDVPGFPSVEYGYAEGVAVANGGIVNYVESRLLDQTAADPDLDKAGQYHYSRDYSDGLGRLLMTRDETTPDPVSGAPRVRVKEATVFHGRAGVQAVLQPFYTEAVGDSLDALLAFENILADGWTGSFHEDGALASETLATAPKVETTFDVPLRPVVMTQADGTTRARRYEPLVVRMFDENDTDPNSPFADTPRVQHSDGLGRLIQVDEVVRLNDDGTPANNLQTWSTNYTWRADDVLLTATDAQGNQKSFAYSGFAELETANDPNRGTTTYEYDDEGNLVVVVDGLGRETLFTFDGANRRLTVDYVDEAETYSVGFAYDPGAPLNETNRADVVYFYDAPATDVDFGNGASGTARNTLGRVATVWDLAGTTHTSYDARGRVAWSLREAIDPITGTTAPYTTFLEHDPLDRVARVIFPDGDEATYGYDAGRNLNRINGGGGVNRSGNDTVLSDAAYTPSGQRLLWRFGNDLATTYRYDRRGRLTRATTNPGAVNADPLLDLTYDFDSASNLSRVSDLRTLDSVPVADPRRNTRLFSYDDRYRLTRAQFAFNAPGKDPADDGSISYRYDRIGNLLEKTSTLDNVDELGLPTANVGVYGYGGAGGTSGRIGGADGETAPGPHAVTSIDDGSFDNGIVYDGAGNVITLNDLSLTWNFDNKLVRAENDEMIARYAYDYSGRRASRRVDFKEAADTLDTTPKSTLYIGKHFEVRDTGQPVKYVYDGDTRLARILGTLNDDTVTRSQRVRLSAGWNVVGLLVAADDLFAQLDVDGDPNLEAVLLVDLNNGTTRPLAESDELFAGTVLFVKATNAGVKTLVGTYAEPKRDTLELRPGYFTFPSWNGTHLATFFPDTIDFAWLFDGPGQQWRANVHGERAFLSDTPAYAAPGTPLFVDLRGSITFDAPGRDQEIQYYVQDHLGSTSLLVDAAGNVLEETAYLPFGEPRLRHVPEDATPAFENTYLFNQKERDAETRLHYFEARYLSGRIGRFMSVDPAVNVMPVEAMENPQLQNAYSYARNNPITVIDPTGLMPKDQKDSGLLPRGNILSDRVKDKKIKISGFKDLLSKVPKEFEFLNPTDVPKAADLLKDVKDAASDLESALEEENADLKAAGKKEIKVDVKAFNKALSNADTNGIGKQIAIFTKFFEQGGPDGLGDLAESKEEKLLVKFLDKVDLNKEFKNLREMAGKSLEDSKDLSLDVGNIDSLLTTFFEGDSGDFEDDFLNELLDLDEDVEAEEDQKEADEEEDSE